MTTEPYSDLLFIVEVSNVPEDYKFVYPPLDEYNWGCFKVCEGETEHTYMYSGPTKHLEKVKEIARAFYQGEEGKTIKKFIRMEINMGVDDYVPC